jgi:hypothetical protein
MRHRPLSSLLLVASLLAALPAAADVYTIRLSNGGTFESRYQPKQAAWDATLVTFVDETGTEIALPQAMIAEVTSQSEVKGYGRVLDTTTIDLGFMPNDLDQSQQAMQQQALMNPAGQMVVGPAAGGQFVEPSAIGGGIPLGFASAPTGFTPTPGVAPGNFTIPPAAGGTLTTPTNTVTPPPFTTPAPAAATPSTTSPQ